jgi:hypothetical protein
MVHLSGEMCGDGHKSESSILVEYNDLMRNMWYLRKCDKQDMLRRGQSSDRRTYARVGYFSLTG